MIANLPLSEMSTVDKISTMEILWSDIIQHPEEIESPSWHGDTLKEREIRLEDGRDTLQDWQDVKKKLLGKYL